MATVATNYYLSIDSNDVSIYVRQMQLSYGAEAPDCTTMGDTAREVASGGLKVWGVTARLVRDVTNVDAVLFPLVGTSIAVSVRDDQGAVAVGNPSYTGNAVLTSYNPVGGAVGDTQEVDIELTPSGGLTRATS